VAKKSTDIVQLKLRFPEALRKQLERAAKADDHSMNIEIVRRLERSFHHDLAADMVSLAMWLESTSEPGGAHIPPRKNWKNIPASAETVRHAVDLILAAVAKLPRNRTTPIDEAHAEIQARAEILATVVLRKFGLDLPSK
jgi:hypothetical protein